MDKAENKQNWINAMIEREATPKPERTDTVEEFAEKHGIDTSTYYYQARKKENKKKIIGIWLNEAVNGGNEVLKKLKENALDGKEKSIEMYLKFILELKEKADITTNDESLNTLYVKFLNGNEDNSGDTTGIQEAIR